MGAELLVHAELVELRPGKKRKYIPHLNALNLREIKQWPTHRNSFPAGRTRKELTHRSIFERCLIRRDGVVVVRNSPIYGSISDKVHYIIFK